MDQMRSKRSLSCRCCFPPKVLEGWWDELLLNTTGVAKPIFQLLFTGPQYQAYNSQAFFFAFIAEKIGDDCSNMMIPVT